MSTFKLRLLPLASVLLSRALLGLLNLCQALAQAGLLAEGPGQLAGVLAEVLLLTDGLLRAQPRQQTRRGVYTPLRRRRCGDWSSKGRGSAAGTRSSLSLSWGGILSSNEVTEK